MSVLFRTCIGSIGVSLCCLPLAMVNAQTPAATRPGAQQTLPAQAQSQPDDPNAVTRSNRATAPSLPSATPGRRPYTANYSGNQANQGQNSEVEQYFANCLLKNNQAEIEISQFAAQQSQNPKVKEYAEKLVKDHQQVVQKLQPLAGNKGAASSSSATSLDATASGDANRLATDTTRTPGSSGTNTAAPGTETRSGAGTTDRDTAESLTASRNTGTNSSDALMQVAQIEEKINDRCNQALREELQQKSGKEFDECYLGAQVGGHMHMLAALEVIPQETQGQLKQIAEEAKPTVQKHLDEAKELMKERKSGSLQQTSATESRR